MNTECRLQWEREIERRTKKHKHKNTHIHRAQMFEGVPDQFHQFTVSRTSLPLPLSFPSLHGSSASFDLYTSHHQHLPLQQPTFVQQTAPSTSKNQDKQENCTVVVNLESERERSMHESIDPWSNDEVLALLRIRSSMENWFPEFTWEHVSR